MSGEPAPQSAGENSGHKGRGRGLIHIDCAYTIANVRARGHETFYEARHRGGYFDRVLGVNPLAGLLENRRGKDIRIVRFSSRQVVLDGFVEGRKLSKWLVPFNVLWSQLRLFRVLLRRAKRPDIRAIFASDPLYIGLLAMLLSKLSNKPFAIGLYANQDELYAATGALAYPRLLRSRRIELAVQRLVLRNAHLVEAPTENMREFALRHGARSDHIAMLPVVKYVQAIHFQPPESRASPHDSLRAFGVPSTPTYLLTVSRLQKLKRVDHAVLAMKAVFEAHPETIGLIAGEGPFGPELEALIKKLGLEQRVFLLGNIDQPTLATIFPHAITLSPLTGLALIEAALGGSPPVAYDRDWQPEFVRDGENGFLVPDEDHQQMAAKALLLLRDPELRNRLGRQARQDALRFADPAEHAAKEKQAFDRMLAMHERGIA